MNNAGQPLDFTEMISGVHEHGCGFEAQNEAWYRFLVQPDPFANISISTDGKNLASLNGYDSVILNQRRAFHRPDSLLAVIVVTDEARINAESEPSDRRSIVRRCSGHA